VNILARQDRTKGARVVTITQHPEDGSSLMVVEVFSKHPACGATWR
jgi:hypothetical protein